MAKVFADEVSRQLRGESVVDSADALQSALQGGMVTRRGDNDVAVVKCLCHMPG